MINLELMSLAASRRCGLEVAGEHGAGDVERDDDVDPFALTFCRLSEDWGRAMATIPRVLR